MREACPTLRPQPFHEPLNGRALGLRIEARERIVKVGARFGSKVEVSGVEAGARVLVRGQTAVADGTAVVVSGTSP